MSPAPRSGSTVPRSRARDGPAALANAVPVRDPLPPGGVRGARRRLRAAPERDVAELSCVLAPRARSQLQAAVSTERGRRVLDRATIACPAGSRPGTVDASCVGLAPRLRGRAIMPPAGGVPWWIAAAVLVAACAIGASPRAAGAPGPTTHAVGHGSCHRRDIAYRELAARKSIHGFRMRQWGEWPHDVGFGPTRPSVKRAIAARSPRRSRWHAGRIVQHRHHQQSCVIGALP
jgi:hypothetical protein